MPKIPECDRCLLYARNPHLVCAVHPAGPNTNTCLDFRADPNAAAEELWEPEGATYYNGELILQPRQRWTPEQQLELLDTHPLFTGRCPRCEMTYPQYETPPVHWDCSACGWWMIRCEAVVRSAIFKLSPTGKCSFATPLGSSRPSPQHTLQRRIETTIKKTSCWGQDCHKQKNIIVAIAASKAILPAVASSVSHPDITATPQAIASSTARN